MASARWASRREPPATTPPNTAVQSASSSTSRQGVPERAAHASHDVVSGHRQLLTSHRQALHFVTPSNMACSFRKWEKRLVPVVVVDWIESLPTMFPCLALIVQ